MTAHYSDGIIRIFNLALLWRAITSLNYPVGEIRKHLLRLEGDVCTATLGRFSGTVFREGKSLSIGVTTARDAKEGFQGRGS